MIELIPSLLVAKGGHRHCYTHPDDPSKCVKVLVSDDQKEHVLEQKYYQHLIKRNISWEMLPRFYGTVETNLGDGAVFDLIRDFDGQVSKTFEYYIKSDEQEKYLSYAFSKAHFGLRDYLNQEVVISRRINSCNIVFKRTNEVDGVMVMIDNIGNTDFLPFSKLFKRLGRSKAQRRWDRFDESLTRVYPDNKLICSIFDIKGSGCA